MADTKMPDTKAYRVVSVGAIYQKPSQTLAINGDLAVALAPTLALRGEEVELVPFEAARLQNLGAVKPVDEERSYDEMSDDELTALTNSRAIVVSGSAADGSVRREDSINALLVYDQGTGHGVVGVGTVPGGVAVSLPGTSDASRVQTGAAAGGSPDPLEVDTDTLAKFIAEGPSGKGLNAEETVALAQGDPARADAVLKAEKQATTGDSRKTVESRLKAISDEK